MPLRERQEVQILLREMKVPDGFKASAVSSGIKAQGLDLALILSEVPCKAVGLFTSNRVKAAPVLYSRSLLRRGREFRAILANSGCANACTGEEGLEDAKTMASLVEEALGLGKHQVLVASTGVIGRRLPLEKVREAIPALIEGLSRDAFEAAARAIMTTDTRPKLVWAEVKTPRVTGTILGMAKGAGMIKPELATMLCFILTDLGGAYEDLRACLKEVVSQTFNAITVDGEQSTNDTVFLLANGLKGEIGLQDLGAFKNALFEVADGLARMIVSDGEGASLFVEVKIRGARDSREAKKAAMRIANSPLVKTALFGKDPNWGRIVAALGDAGVPLNPKKISVWINGIQVASKGKGTGISPQALREAMITPSVTIEVDMGRGQGEFRVYTCDFTYDYVRINAEYTT